MKTFQLQSSLLPIFPPPLQTNQNWHYLCTLLENNQGLTGFDSKDSGIVSMPGL
jgi:hypothetical protein